MAIINSTKISGKWYIVWFGNLYVKVKQTDINFIKATRGNPTPPYKKEIRLVYTEGNVC